MSRKARKQIELHENQTVEFKVAGYVRLSVSKENQNSDSIENQINIINNYIDHIDDMILQKLYIDENKTGTNFNRKAFQDMLNDISSERVNCVIVKDLSRLGRDLLSVGYYVQQYFPERKVRFISINDKFDTMDGIANLNNSNKPISRIPLTALVDEHYTDDISEKVQASIDVNIRNGKFVAPRAPFGYKKDEYDCHKLIIDKEAAIIVKEIFDLAYLQNSVTEIVRTLNLKGYLTPMDYAVSNGLHGNYNRGNGKWNTRTVKHILSNKVYTGDLEQGKENYLVKNTHEPIITREIFDKIQSQMRMPNTHVINNNKNSSDNLFKGKIICGGCGGKMQRRKKSGKKEEYFYFSCITNNRVAAGSCGGMYVRESDIIAVVKNAVKEYISKNRQIYSNHIEEQQVLVNKIRNIQKQLNTPNYDLKTIFEKYDSGSIDKEKYIELKLGISNLKNEVTEYESMLQNRINWFKMYEEFNNGCFDSIIKDYTDTITIYDRKNIKVQFLKNNC